jgi:hypothetical protein
MTPTPPMTADKRLAALLADTTPVGYHEISRMIDRDRQSVRVALSRRRKRIRDTGRARPSDIPEPSGYRSTEDRILGRPVTAGTAEGDAFEEPWWPRNVIVRWAMQNGKLATDGVTPLYYRDRNKDRAREAA